MPRLWHVCLEQKPFGPGSRLGVAGGPSDGSGECCCSDLAVRNCEPEDFRVANLKAEGSGQAVGENIRVVVYCRVEQRMCVELKQCTFDQ